MPDARGCPEHFLCISTLAPGIPGSPCVGEKKTLVKNVREPDMSEASSRGVKAFGGRNVWSAQGFPLPQTQAPPGLFLILPPGEMVAGERQAAQEEGEEGRGVCFGCRVPVNDLPQSCFRSVPAHQLNSGEQSKALDSFHIGRLVGPSAETGKPLPVT